MLMMILLLSIKVPRPILDINSYDLLDSKLSVHLEDHDR
jgi:hypothetical protein